MTKGFKIKRESISIKDILPDLPQGERLSQLLTLSDIITPRDDISAFTKMTTKVSYEYDLILPVDIEKAFRLNITGLKVTIINKKNMPKNPGQNLNNEKSYSFDVNFFDDLPDSINTGETDTDEFLRKVKKTRRIIKGPDDTIKNSNLKGNVVDDFTPKPLAMAVNSINIMANILKSPTADPIDTMLGCKIKSSRTEVEDLPAGQGFDPIFLPFIKVSDGENRTGVSLKEMKEALLIEATNEASSISDNTQSALVNIFENPEESEDRHKTIQYIDYTTTILPIKRKIILHSRKVVPHHSITLMIQPIVNPQPGRDRANTAIKKFNFDLSEEYISLLEPVCPPSLRIIANGRGNLVVELDKKDPTIKTGIATVSHFNPIYPEAVLPTQSKTIRFNNNQKIVEQFDGLHNIDPIITTVTFHALHPVTDDASTSTSKKIKSFDSHIKYLIPDCLDEDDSIRIFAYSQSNGVLLKIEGTGHNIQNMFIHREDVGAVQSNRLQHVTLGKVSADVDHEGNFVFLDSNVIKNRVYRYTLTYQKISDLKIFEKFHEWEEQQRTLGQHGSGTYLKKSSSSATVKYKKSNIVQDIKIGKASVDLQRGGSGTVSMIVSYKKNPSDLEYSDIREIASSVIADQGANLLGRSQQLSTKIPMAIIERINRVTGDEKEVGVIVIQPGETKFVDDSFFLDVVDVESVKGKFTYKFKVCMPTVGSLNAARVPLFGNDKATDTINALKLTSEVFTQDGRLQSSAFLENPSYIDIIKSSDTGSRVYSDFDLKSSSNEKSDRITTLEGTRVKNGHRINWMIQGNMTQSLEGFLVFKTQGESKELIGVVKYVNALTNYSYSDVSSFARVIPIFRQYTYIIIPITKTGVYLQESNGYNTSDVYRQIFSAENLAKTMARFPATVVVEDIDHWRLR